MPERPPAGARARATHHQSGRVRRVCAASTLCLGVDRSDLQVIGGKSDTQLDVRFAAVLELQDQQAPQFASRGLRRANHVRVSKNHGQACQRGALCRLERAAHSHQLLSCR
jgi:hypothetical protein